MGIERLFADSQLLRQIVHGDSAKPMSEEVGPGRFHDPLPSGLSPPLPRPFVNLFHIQSALIPEKPI